MMDLIGCGLLGWHVFKIITGKTTFDNRDTLLYIASGVALIVLF